MKSTLERWTDNHQLSGGQLQRLLVARALLLDTQFLVADEIISMLNASTRIDVLNLLADLKSHGLSILFITHDLSLVTTSAKKWSYSIEDVLRKWVRQRKYTQNRVIRIQKY